MTTRRRATLLRTGVVATLAAGLLAVAASPASADQNDIRLTVNPESTALNVGGQGSTIRIKVENTGNEAVTNVAIGIAVPLANLGVEVTDRPSNCQRLGVGLSCGITALPAKQADTIEIRVSPPQQSNLQPNETQTGQGFVRVGGTDTTEQFAVSLKQRAGQAEVQTVASVSGNVVGLADSQPIADSEVRLVDGAGKTHSTTTDGSGTFRFTGSASNVIAPGTLTLTANKTDYSNQGLSKRVTAKAGDQTSVRLQLKATAAVPTPSSVASDAVAPPATEAPSVEAAPNTAAATKPASSSGGLFSWTLIAMGGLLVLLGIGAIVLLLRRNKDDSDDDEPGPDPDQGPGGSAAVPGAGPQGWHTSASTMAARSGGVADSNDATAMLEPAQPQYDEFPDPYNPPRAPYPVGAPAGPTERTGRTPASPYFAPTRNNAADRGAFADGGYRDQGGYGGSDGYAEARDADRTGRYDDHADGRGYDGPPGGGYNEPGGYGVPQQRGDYRDDSEYRPATDPYAKPASRQGGQGRVGRRLDWLDD